MVHITYDTYFWDGAAPALGASKMYPADIGLTMGVLPFEKLQLEVGFDLLLPSTDPLVLNAKLGSPEGALFEGSPGWSLGIFGVGLAKDVTDTNVLSFVVGKTLPHVGIPQVGVYYGLNKKLFLSSDGTTNQFGIQAGWFFPDIVIEAPWLYKITPAADIATGKNAIGAAGGGLYLFFTPAISLLFGPVYFLDPALQPGGSPLMWTMQLDVDLDLKKSK